MSRIRTLPKHSESDIELAYDAAQKVVETHRRLSTFLEPGLTLAQIDTFVAQTLADLGGKSCFRGYKAGKSPPFPSHACLSVNDCVVHGTAGYRKEPLGDGDILKIDIGIVSRGWIGDAAWTYVFGEPSDEIRKLCQSGKDSLKRGIDTLGKKRARKGARKGQEKVSGTFVFRNRCSPSSSRPLKKWDGIAR